MLLLSLAHATVRKFMVTELQWLTLTPEELSNQRRSMKISDGTETKGTELDVLQKQWNKGAKD